MIEKPENRKTWKQIEKPDPYKNQAHYHLFERMQSMSLPGDWTIVSRYNRIRAKAYASLLHPMKFLIEEDKNNSDFYTVEFVGD